MCINNMVVQFLELEKCPDFSDWVQEFKEYYQKKLEITEGQLGFLLDKYSKFRYLI
jgi:hypothetical protein